MNQLFAILLIISSYSLCISMRVEILNRVISAIGPVAMGYGRGSKKLGFPTANLPYFDYHIKRDKLQSGVYFGWAYLKNKRYNCVSNIGTSPTFVGQENKISIIENYLLDCDHSNDFYNELLSIYLIGFIRPEIKFNSLNDLINQINSDVSITREILTIDIKIDGKVEESVSKYFKVVNDIESDTSKFEKMEIIDSDKRIAWKVIENNNN